VIKVDLMTVLCSSLLTEPIAWHVRSCDGWQLLHSLQVLKAKDDGDSGNSGLILLVELWRSDLVTSVVELDSEGNVMSSADHQATLMELYPAGVDDMVLIMETCLFHFTCMCSSAVAWRSNVTCRPAAGCWVRVDG
jgi:hypothetical protein